MTRARPSKRSTGLVSPEIQDSERPAEVADRAVPGHWEGDDGWFWSLGPRHAGRTPPRRLRCAPAYSPVKGPGEGPHAKDDLRSRERAASRARCDTATLITCPKIASFVTGLRDRNVSTVVSRSMAGNPGLLLRSKDALRAATPPNENTNGGLRQYFPKGTRSDIYDADENAVAQPSSDPRNTLGWTNPREALDECCPQ